MSTMLIRCSLHDELTHEQFRDWIRGRRDEIIGDGSAVTAVHAARMAGSTWIVELDLAPESRESGAGSRGDAVASLYGDLRLLGLKPVLFTANGEAPETVPAASGAYAR